MRNLTVRPLLAAEADRVLEIDRSEEIDSIYALVAGELVLQPFLVSVRGWNPDDAPGYPRRIRAVLAGGGAASGALDGDHLVGISTLDIAPVGGDPGVMTLDLLHVSAGYRGQGIGKWLTMLVIEQARELGARALYISATPTRNTVDAYRRMGAQVLAIPDPEKLALEPDDIHLLLPIAEHPVSGEIRSDRSPAQ